ncbi:hypothetical protein FPCIR_4602 [Fusarium pseudocircinatum]|uniref:Xylanolytic transcriptional activator regulatory domain-containing protein n=1 Tax=Fusarium pseudocircinatum TaxID=56676 RepID=A0A8H5UQZ8_9HYPO|nr:hypothetical protein FPCIR_4602 [Fusarium pseudocircinatum]
MAGRIASLERSLAEATTRMNLSCNSIEPRRIVNEKDSRKDLLFHKGSTDQYLNEILVTRVVSEDESIATALATSQHEPRALLSSPFDLMGIMSSPCYTQHPSAFHPSKATAIELWNIYLNNVEIILGLKFTHIPTDEVRVYSTIDDPASAKFDDLAFCYSIYFAAAISLEDSTSFFPDKATELQRFKMGIEQAFAHGDFFNRPTLTGLRALAIYLSAIRVHNRGKSVWILNGLVIRIAQSLGLHKDGTKLGLPPFESELRRRLWWHIITRDSRSGEDFGLEDPNDLLSTSDVKPPLNLNDADIFPEMEDLPVERTEWTGMTFSLINVDLAKAMETLKGGNPSTSTLRKEGRDKILRDVHTRVKSRLEKCNPVTPHQRLTVHCANYLLRKLDFVTNQQWLLLQKREVSDSVLKKETLVAALDILEARTAGDDPFLAQFSWAKKVHPQYHVSLYVLWYLCTKPQGPHVERAWRAIDSIFEQEMAFDFIGCAGAKPAVLKALRTKAETRRKNLDSSSVRVGCNTEPAASTELEHMEDSLTFLEGFNFDDEVFENGVTVVVTALQNHFLKSEVRKSDPLAYKAMNIEMATILVTGANRGIGFAIVQAIATRLPSSTIVLGSRKKGAAQEAIESLIDSGIKTKLGYVDLDIENDASIEAAVATLEQEYGKLDVLINNAGKVEQRSSDDLADIRAASNSCYNNLITSNAIVTHAFGKLLRKSSEPRIIMISSARGSMARTNNKEPV